MALKKKPFYATIGPKEAGTMDCTIRLMEEKDRAEVAMALYICTFSIFYTKCYYVTMLIIKRVYIVD